MSALVRKMTLHKRQQETTSHGDVEDQFYMELSDTTQTHMEYTTHYIHNLPALSDNVLLLLYHL